MGNGGHNSTSVHAASVKPSIKICVEHNFYICGFDFKITWHNKVLFSLMSGSPEF